ncbi:MAG: 50S ribosomal protein L29 [Terriglobia bacterium]
MKVAKIREWSVDELKAKDREFAEQLFRLKFQFASGQSDILEKMRVLRRDIARVKTLLREEELKAETGGRS